MSVLKPLQDNVIPLAVGLTLGSVIGLSSWKVLKWSKIASTCEGMVIAAVPIMVKSVVSNRKTETDNGLQTQGSDTGSGTSGLETNAPRNPLVTGDQIEPLLRQCTEYGTALGEAWGEICKRGHPLSGFQVRWLVPDCNDLSSLNDTDRVLEFFCPMGTEPNADGKSFYIHLGTLKKLQNQETASNCLYYEYNDISADSPQDAVFRRLTCPYGCTPKKKGTNRIVVTDVNGAKAEILIGSNADGDRTLEITYFCRGGSQAYTRNGPIKNTITAEQMRLKGGVPIWSALSTLSALNKSI